MTTNYHVDKAVKAIDLLTPPQLIEVLSRVSDIYKQSHADLKEVWFNVNTSEPDVDAGKIWDIAAQGLEKTANDIKQHWESL